jgi:N-formylglutamate deformylase
MSDFARHDAVELLAARGKALPVIFDSPHSGTLYPDDFGHSVDPLLLMGGEDRFVDDLVIDAPRHGIALVRALFARTYIDPNRDADDLDPELLEEDWPVAISPGRHGARGLGLIFRLTGTGQAIYERRLPPAEVDHRIAGYWKPYHDCLEQAIDGAHRDHGVAWHVNWHSMQPVGSGLAPDPGETRPDFVLGDLYGSSCAAEFTSFVAMTLEALGYSVAINRPFSGAHIVERYGRPAEGRHSLQIEINRRLYMDVATLERTCGFEALRSALDAFAGRLADWVRAPDGGEPRLL